MKTIQLSEIAGLLGLPPLTGDQGGREITGLASLGEATATELSFLASDKYLTAFSVTRAAAVIVDRKIKLGESDAIALIVDSAELAMAKVLAMFAPPVPAPGAGIDPLARVDPSAVIDESVAIGPFVVVGKNVRIGAGCVLHAQCHVGDDSVLGEHCVLHPFVCVRERITLGSRVIIHANSNIGSDGFGYRWGGQGHVKIPQIGTVVIEDDVEIGSCVCIDRAKFGATRIGRGSKIDNLVQIAHNAQLGPHCIMAGQSGVAGSVKLGAGVMLGGQCAIRDHVTMGDGAMAAACSGVAEDVPAKGIVSGIPAIAHRQYLRGQNAVAKLPDLMAQVRKLQAEIEQIKDSLGQTSDQPPDDVG